MRDNKNNKKIGNVTLVFLLHTSVSYIIELNASCFMVNATRIIKRGKNEIATQSPECTSCVAELSLICST